MLWSGQGKALCGDGFDNGEDSPGTDICTEALHLDTCVMERGWV